MKKTNKIITIIMLISILTISLFISTVNASVTIGASDSNRTVGITRNVTGVTNNVTNTFTYTIAQDTTYNSETVTNYPTSTTVVFNNVQPSSGTATQTGTVDFAGATFSKVGDYRFILTETGSTDSTQYPLDNSTYYLYVSVRYAAGDTNGTQMVATVASQGIKNDTNDVNAQTPGTKENVVFTSESVFTYITIEKQVTGNMGDKSKYFDITVTVPGTGTYLVSGGKYGTPATSSTSVTAGSATTLQIKHGETITIGIAADGTTKQIPVGSSYTVAETSAEGYETTIDSLTAGTLTTTKQAAVIPANNQLPATNKVTIVNHYELATLTGVFLNIMPYVIIAAAVIILIALVRRSSKKKEE